MSSMGQMFSQMTNMYRELTLGKKISFLIFLAIGIGAFSILVMVAKTPDYRLLYNDLDAEDLNDITAFLKENRVDFKLANGGSSILVPSDDFYDARMQLAGAGLPQGGSQGFEIFDNKSLGMTDFQQSINFQRALQGELTRTIQQISAIEACRVHLVMPKQSLFKEDQNETTASVAIKLRKNGRLSEEQVESIVFLVSGSVEGLDPNNVTIIDSKGKILSKKREDDLTGPVNSAMLEYKQKVEKNMERSIVSLLAKSVGAEKIAAKVTADIDFRQVTTTKESYDPESQVARSEKTTDELSDSSEAQNSAAPGTDANMPDAPDYSEGSNSSAKVAKRVETINYEISRQVSQINEPVGEVKALSVAVMIDGIYKKTADGNVYAERSKQEMDKFTQLVKTAIGFNEERGDKLEVLNVPFAADESFSTVAGLGNDNRELIGTIINHSLIGLGLLLIAIFVMRPMIRWLTAEPAYEAAAELAGMLPSGVAELEAKILRGATMDSVKELPAGEETIDPGQARMKQLAERRNAIQASAGKDRKAIAAILKKWLKEDE